mgnify:CR=1 FL=1
MPLEIGQMAPDFTLTSATGDPVSLSDYRGRKVLLMFFPFAFTGICTGEVCEISEDLSVFADLDAVVLSVSCDAAPTLRKFAEIEGIDYPLLSDHWPHGQVAQAYGVFLEQVGAANRGSFIIDRDGEIAWSTVTSLGQGRDLDEYKMVLKGLD